MLELYIGAACFFIGAFFGTYATLFWTLRHLGSALESSHAWREIALDILKKLPAPDVKEGPISWEPHDKKG